MADFASEWGLVLLVLAFTVLGCLAMYAVFGGGALGTPRSKALVVSRLLAAALVCASVPYFGWAAYISLFASEGLVPPTWRNPDLPEGAQTLSSETFCGSGGCTRTLELQPKEGQAPEELAEELGVATPDHQSWRWYDPHSVWVWSNTGPDETTLTVNVSYLDFVR